MGPCMYRPNLCLAAFERRCQTSGCNIAATNYAHILLSTGACLASLPLLSRFGVGAVLICSCCCLPPWGGGTGHATAASFSLVSHRGYTLSLVVGILEIPITSAVVFPLLPHQGYGECALPSASLSVTQEGPVLSPVDLSTSCIREPVVGSC